MPGARLNPPPQEYLPKCPPSRDRLCHRLDNLLKLPAPLAKLLALGQRHRRRIDILGLDLRQIARETKLRHQSNPNCRSTASTAPRARIASAIRASCLCLGSSGSYRILSGIFICVPQGQRTSALNFVVDWEAWTGSKKDARPRVFIVDRAFPSSQEGCMVPSRQLRGNLPQFG